MTAALNLAQAYMAVGNVDDQVRTFRDASDDVLATFGSLPKADRDVVVRALLRWNSDTQLPSDL